MGWGWGPNSKLPVPRWSGRLERAVPNQGHRRLLRRRIQAEITERKTKQNRKNYLVPHTQNPIIRGRGRRMALSLRPTRSTQGDLDSKNTQQRQQQTLQYPTFLYYLQDLEIHCHSLADTSRRGVLGSQTGSTPLLQAGCGEPDQYTVGGVGSWKPWFRDLAFCSEDNGLSSCVLCRHP